MKSTLLRLLLWLALKIHRCKLNILNHIEFIYSDSYKIFDLLPVDRERSFTHIVINKGGVEVHAYSSHPREPYNYEKYDSIDSFVAKFLQEPISERDYKSAVSTKDIIFAVKGSHDQSISQDQRVEHMRRFSRLVADARSRLNRNAQREVKAFMSGFIYKIFRLAIKY